MEDLWILLLALCVYPSSLEDSSSECSAGELAKVIRVRVAEGALAAATVAFAALLALVRAILGSRESVIPQLALVIHLVAEVVG